jgi:hypothetical protein
VIQASILACFHKEKDRRLEPMVRTKNSRREGVVIQIKAEKLVIGCNEIL